MTKNVMQEHHQTFEEIKQTSRHGAEYWMARRLSKILGYSEFRNFLPVIEKAKKACKNSGQAISDHFVEMHEMVDIGSGAQREMESYALSRYACYLIVQNGDSSKPVIANGQTYFAIQTRKQELSEDRMPLPQNIYERGVDDAGFGRIRSKGDAALFGGHTTQALKDRFGITKTRPLADFLPMLTIAAKNLATEMTNHNVGEDDLHGEPAITQEHIQNNQSRGEKFFDPTRSPTIYAASRKWSR